MDTLSRRQAMKAGTASAAVLLSGPAAAIGQPRDGADHPWRLWYRQPAAAWTEALPIGNGRVGAMVFGGAGSERLQLNCDTLYAGGPYRPNSPEARGALADIRRMVFERRYADAEALINARMMARPLKQMPYQTAGDLTFTLPALATTDRYERALDLDTAIARVSFTSAGVHYVREVFASAIDGVIAVRLTVDRPGALDVAVALQPGQIGKTDARGPDIVFLGHNQPSSGIDAKLSLAIRARIIAPGARIAVEGDTLVVRGATEMVAIVALDTSHRRYDDVSGKPADVTAVAIDRAARKGWDALREAHVTEHRRLFRRMTIDLGRTAAADRPTDARIAALTSPDSLSAPSLAADPALVALYHQFGRYLLIASSHAGSQPANLQGIWNDSNRPPWDSKYTININTEMNYWPAEPTGLAECVEPLVRMVEDLAVTGAETARVMYGARGWVAHHNTDLWRATAPIDGAQWGMWPTGGAWLCLHLWDRWDYGRDPAFLRRIYPLLRDAALFFLDTLVRYPGTDWLATNPSLSPENQHPHGSSICAGPTMDMQILRDLFDHVVAAAAILGTDASLAKQVAAARARLVPNRIGAQGQLMEWIEDWDLDAPDLQHRHVSHLYGLYPSAQISLEETPALATAARRSLRIRSDNATGWGLAWRLNLWARLDDGEHAHAILGHLLGPGRTYPNMFDSHPPFQIDGNFGGTAGITEMLVRSRGQTIDLLPALPGAWPDGSIRGVRVRGAAELDLAWNAGVLQHVRMQSAISETWTLHYGDRQRRVTLSPGQTLTLNPADFRRQDPGSNRPAAAG